MLHFALAGLTATKNQKATRAKPDGRWANIFFKSLNKQNRYAVLFRVTTVKKPETRAKRIAEFVAMLGRGEKLHP